MLILKDCDFHFYFAGSFVGCTDPLSQLQLRVQKDGDDEEEDGEEVTDGRRADGDGKRRNGQNGSPQRGNE